MEGTIYFSGGLASIAKLLGIPMRTTSQFPPKWVELFVDTNNKTYTAPVAPGRYNPPGWDKEYDYGSFEHQLALGEITQEEYDNLTKGNGLGIKFWDIVNVIALIIIIATALFHHKNVEAQGGQVTPVTWAIFGMLGLLVSIGLIPKFITNFSLNKFQKDMR